jgi:hypothetical protein
MIASDLDRLYVDNPKMDKLEGKKHKSRGRGEERMQVFRATHLPKLLTTTTTAAAFQHTNDVGG